MSKRIDTAMAVLNNGGKVREGMRTDSYTVVRKNMLWLEDAAGRRIDGIGPKTCRALLATLVRDWTMHPGSTWEKSYYLPQHLPTGARYDAAA